MIREAIGNTLPLAVGIAASPIPIIAVILMLFTARARQNGPAFVAGWMLGLFAITGLAALVVDGAGADSDAGTNDLVDWLKLLLGAGMLILAYKQWQQRPAAGEEAAMPGWMSSVESFSPSKAFGLALLLSANPKNLVLAISAGAAIGQTPGLSLGPEIVAVVVFVLIASATTAGAVAYYLLGGASAEERLDDFKGWLTQNNATIMAVILLVLGAVLAGQGISGLAD
jgi:hypothetical protein